MNAEKIILGILTGVESLHLFSARLPSRLTIRKFVENEEDRQNIIIALRESIAVSLALIIVISFLSKSFTVFIISIVMLSFIVFFYLSDLGGVIKGMKEVMKI